MGKLHHQKFEPVRACDDIQRRVLRCHEDTGKPVKIARSVRHGPTQDHMILAAATGGIERPMGFAGPEAQEMRL